MAMAAPTEKKPVSTSASTSARTSASTSARTSARRSERGPARPSATIPLFPLATLPKKRLPAGRPREWYVNHNRRLKAMRLAIALLDTGVHDPRQARNRKIRATAAQIGVHPPSNTTCRVVRSLIDTGTA
jgi:hypothetical protein